MSIVIIGYRGAGKSTLAKALAKRLSLDRVSTDQRVERVLGQSISSFVAQSGWEAFRNIEREVIETICREVDQAKKPLIVDTGGGVVEDERSMNGLKRLGLIVWLKISVEEHLRRLRQDEGRPSLTDDDLETETRSTLQRREPLYARYGDFVFEAENHSLEVSLDSLIQELRARGGLPPSISP